MTADLGTQDARAAWLARTDRAEMPAWFRTRRREAFEQFEAAGFPTIRDEEWRHTDVGRIARAVFAPPPPLVLKDARALASRAGAAGAHGGPVLVFVNGRHVPALSLLDGIADGVQVTDFASALATSPEWLEGYWGRVAPVQGHPFTALATALAEDGAVIRVRASRHAEAPIRILFLAAGADAPAIESHARVLLVVEDGAQAELVEVHAGEGAAFANVVTEIVAGAGAQVGHVKLQRLQPEAFQIAHTSATLARDARLSSVTFAFGAALARNEIAVQFAAPGGECTLDGLWLGDRSQHLDQQTFVDHAHPHCTSRQLYKGILGGAARGVFYGRVLVRPDAQQTSAHQANRNLLLSETALVDTKPQLEIFADDVQCTHGATIGRLDEDALFYLRSRGLAVAEAQDLLLQAFAYEILERVRPEAARAEIEAVLAARLAALGSAPVPSGRSTP